MPPASGSVDTAAEFNLRKGKQKAARASSADGKEAAGAGGTLRGGKVPGGRDSTPNFV